MAGDTENIPEMKKLKRIECAFLPMNLSYTMNLQMVADAAKAFKPNLLSLSLRRNGHIKSRATDEGHTGC